VVRLGFTMVYLGFGYGLVALYLAARRVHRHPRRPRRAASIAAAVAATICITSFWLPAISGLRRGTLSSWAGLDPLSSGAAALLAAALVTYALLPAAGDDLRGLLVASLGATLALLVTGNAVIQTFTERGTDAEWGLYLAGASSLVAAAAGLVAHRTEPDGVVDT
jgi:hypothetical protein